MHITVIQPSFWRSIWKDREFEGVHTTKKDDGGVVVAVAIPSFVLSACRCYE